MFVVMLAQAVGAFADDAAVATFTLKTSKAIGEKISIEAICVSKTDPVTVDWGDGGQVEYKPKNSWSSMVYADGEVKAQAITVTGKIKELTIKSAGLTSFEATGASVLEKLYLNKNELTGIRLNGMPALKYFNADNNQIVSEGLDISEVAPTLTDLSLRYNQLTTLDIRQFSSLNYFYADHNPDLTTVLFTDGSKSLKSIDMSSCHIMHFYAISLPNLNTLNLSDNALIDDDYTVSFEDGDYPNLHTLGLANNHISVVNLAHYPTLTSVSVNGNTIKRLNVGVLPDLNYLNCADNKLTYLNVSANKNLSTLICGGNDLTTLDITGNSSISTLNISDTQISNIDLQSQYSLKEFKAANTQCASFNFNFCNPWGPLSTIDVRNNANMTAQALNMMYKSMPARSRDSYTTTVFIEGCPGAEQSNTDYLNSGNMKWKTDVTGDDSAQMTDVNISVDATDTGVQDVFTGEYGSDKDGYKLTKWAADNGEFYITQWDGAYYQQHKDVKTSAHKGVPAWVVAMPAKGYRLKEVRVNGVVIADTVFTPVADATVKVLFEKEPHRIKFATQKGTMLGFGVRVAQNATPVEVYWGSGQPEHYLLKNDAATYFDDNAIGDSITVCGDVTALIAYSFPDSEELGITIDNKISAIDFSGNDLLTHVDLYGNPLKKVDVSNLKDLDYLDVSSLDDGMITTLSLGNNPKLTTLKCYNNKIQTLDLSQCAELAKLDAKNNDIESIDLNDNAKLTYVNLTNNQLADIDLKQLPALTDLLVSGNKLTSIDVSKNTKLQDLTVADNKLTQLDLGKNKALVSLSFQGNAIHTLDLSKNTNLLTINCGNNGMSACDLDEFFWTLPTYPDVSADKRPAGATLTLNMGTEDTPNEWATSDTSIATSKGWFTNTTGDATGCETAYLTYDAPVNGTVVLTDEQGNVIKSGEKVKKNSTITIKATPAAGYKYDGLRIDNVVYAGKTEITITRYTNIEFGFSKATGIDNVSADEIGVSVIAARGAITVAAPEGASATVFAANGKAVDAAAVNGNHTFAVAAGTYVVKVSAADGKTATVKVAVK